MPIFSEQYGLELMRTPRPLSELLADAPGIVALRDNLWHAADDRLSGDDESVALADLDASERARHDAARARCMCGPCTMLRPDEEIETAMLGALASAGTAGSAAWYVARMERTSPKGLEAIVQAAGSETLRDVVERYAARVPATWDTLSALLSSLSGLARGRAVLDRDVPPSVRHNVVLGIVNLHVPKRSPSQAVRARLEREGERRTDAGRLAKWFVETF